MQDRRRERERRGDMSLKPRPKIRGNINIKPKTTRSTGSREDTQDPFVQTLIPAREGEAVWVPCAA
jgi:hypothetical protein